MPSLLLISDSPQHVRPFQFILKAMTINKGEEINNLTQIFLINFNETTRLNPI